MNIIMISGSRNPEGQTARTADAVLKGLATTGASVERVFLPVLNIERCRQCDDNGWGLCRQAGECVIEDNFAGLVEKIRQADAVVFANPVYYGDLSESLRAFTDRLRRICTQDTGRMGIKGKPAVGICVAGGGGGGAPECCVSLKRMLSISGFDVVDMVPVRRQNLQTKLPRLEMLGEWLAENN
ncbi:MAG: flavodoxin family protein [Anaerolineaceae bacterium]|nr:flavodoxin family protein [Anaerolineaceae bacterium]